MWEATGLRVSGTRAMWASPFLRACWGACPAGAMGSLAVRDRAAAPTRELAGEVAEEVEPAGADGVAVAADGIGAGA